MGEFTIGTSMTLFVWIVSLGIIVINLYIVGGFVVEQGNSGEGDGGWLYTCVGVGGSLYLFFVLFLMWPDFVKFKRHAGSFFLKLGGYDEVGRYEVFPDSPGNIQGDGDGRSGRERLAMESDEGDDSSELLGPQSARRSLRSLSGPGEGCAPSSRVVAFDEMGDGEHRYNGVGVYPGRLEDGGSPTASLTEAVTGGNEYQRDEGDEDSRA